MILVSIIDIFDTSLTITTFCSTTGKYRPSCISKQILSSELWLTLLMKAIMILDWEMNLILIFNFEKWEKLGFKKSFCNFLTNHSWNLFLELDDRDRTTCKLGKENKAHCTLWDYLQNEDRRNFTGWTKFMCIKYLSNAC